MSIGYRKKQQKHIIASEINIEVKEGDLVALIGMNGVGKSTLLRTLTGLQSALSGRVFFGGANREEIPPQQLATLISLVLTEQPISRNLQVGELIALGRQPYTNWIGRLTEEDKHQVRTAMKLVEIENLESKKCFELSDGQLQKALIARALAQNTPLLILDEPTSHLDIYHQAQVLQLLRKLSSQTKKGILFASHQINLALQLCDQIILMKPDGIQQGTPEDLIASKAFETMFPSDLIIFDNSTQSFKVIKKS